MKTIVVPTDFSLHSENALRTAACIAKKNNAAILVIHMAGITDGLLTKAQANSALESVYYVKLAEKQFAEFLDKPYLSDVSVSQAVKKYRNFSEINDVAKEHNASLIVMSSHGSSGLEEVLIGSNTEKVVRSSEVPVLVIKQFISNFNMDSGVFASNFSEENIEAYKNAKDFFNRFEARMNLVYVNTPGRNFKSSQEIDAILFHFFEGAGYSNPTERVRDVTVISDYSVEEGIFSYSQLIDADIIAIPTHGRKGLAHLLKGSISEDIANHSILPVVTFKI
ncbi:MAG: universal stress protein [Flavobacteriales bacterium]|jgi:nucleotide-binding universal stress UspA family protein|uniref:universal stress protein n=1 Tax=Candidatus Ulvibacter alkanivorans TaxID=2267620 RepID=UPI000DF3D3EF|nr:universal stress protein [Candidatus Ulvibacter alkanivorans]MCH2489368.1 universal stress protein [Flavobacteriales bacterium]